MEFRNWIIPIKYKFLLVLLTITSVGIGVFFYFTSKIFTEDKKLFVMDYNITLLRAATSEIKLELRTRLEELQVIIPRIYQPTVADEKKDTYDSLTQTLQAEMLRMRFYRNTPSGKYETVREYLNTRLLDKRKINPRDMVEIDKAFPLELEDFFRNPVMQLLNRSVRLIQDKTANDIPIITFVLPGSFVDSDSRELVIVVDMLQDFLRKKLHQSEMAQLFLITKKGTILSHGLLTPTIQFAKVPFQHPIVDRIKNRSFPRESFELQIDDEPHLVNLAETGFPDILAVSQIKKSEAFAAVKTLTEKSLLIAALILCIATIVTVIFAAGLTSNIQRLQIAAEKIGSGNLHVKLNIRSNDEIQSVARSFSWMIKRLGELIEESATKARMEEELETARLVQSTLLASPHIDSDRFEIQSHYVPATECGGDVWDLHADGDTVTFFIADATGHGAPAAIVTAVAKSSFSTLNSIYQGQALSPEQYLTLMNQIIYSACRGKLLMTMCIVQIDLKTGAMKVANAGHESPMCLRSDDNPAESAENSDKSRKGGPEIFFARGERLGFDPNIEYKSEEFQLATNDTVLLYTDGVSEARNIDGKEFGERALRKVFAQSGPRQLSQIKSRIVEAVNAHTQSAVQEDDITFVLFSLLSEVDGSRQEKKGPTPKSSGKSSGSGDGYDDGGESEAA